jgi:hypothetical protein
VPASALAKPGQDARRQASDGRHRRDRASKQLIERYRYVEVRRLGPTLPRPGHAADQHVARRPVALEVIGNQLEEHSGIFARGETPHATIAGLREQH